MRRDAAKGDRVGDWDDECEDEVSAVETCDIFLDVAVLGSSSMGEMRVEFKEVEEAFREWVLERKRMSYYFISRNLSFFYYQAVFAAVRYASAGFLKPNLDDQRLT